jgi:hypothetical protein
VVSRADAAGPSKLNSPSLQALSRGSYTIHQRHDGHRGSSIVIIHHPGGHIPGEHSYSIVPRQPSIVRRNVRRGTEVCQRSRIR